MTWNKKWTLPAMLLILSSCSNGIVSSGCTSWKPIRLAAGEAARLSPESRTEILKHNLTGAELCGWKANG